MRFEPLDPPRRFTVGRAHDVTLADCGSIDLDADEQVTFVGPGGVEYDVARKEWGFYATPSLNARLPRFGLRPALVVNGQRHAFVVLVEASKEPAFTSYADAEELRVLAWLDSDDAVADLIEKMES